MPILGIAYAVPASPAALRCRVTASSQTGPLAAVRNAAGAGSPGVYGTSAISASAFVCVPHDIPVQTGRENGRNAYKAKRSIGGVGHNDKPIGGVGHTANSGPSRDMYGTQSGGP